MLPRLPQEVLWRITRVVYAGSVKRHVAQCLHAYNSHIHTHVTIVYTCTHGSKHVLIYIFAQVFICEVSFR